MNIKTKLVRYDFSSTRVFVGTFLFSLLMQIPNWPEVFFKVYSYEMKDRFTYELMLLERNLPTDFIFDFYGLMYFTYEWTWNSGLSYLHRDLGLDPSFIFLVISFFVIWRFSTEIVERVGWMYLPFLVNPLVIDYAFSQLRLAFALAIVSLVWRGGKSHILTAVVYLFCMTIHTAVLIFAAMHFLSRFNLNKNYKNLIILIGFGFAVSVATGPLREQILGAIGDRRVDYHDMSSSLLYLSFWFVLWLLLLIRWKSTFESIDGRYSIIVLSIVVMNIVTGGYSIRFISAAFPSLIIVMANWGRSSALMFVFSLYGIFQWLYWFKILG